MRVGAIKELIKTKSRQAARGFSLIEIMIALLLIGVIVSLVGVVMFNQLKEGQISAARTQANEISKALDMYRLRFGSYPSTSEGLQALVNPSKGEPIMERLPKDPWGEDYIYINPGIKNKNRPDVRSKGPDRLENTEDDVGNWPAEE